jgi:nicotinate phosphoribosyltransferase
MERLRGNYSLLTDAYELFMSDSYVKSKKDTEGVFDLFYRVVPNGGGYTVMAGLDKVIEYIQNLRFTEEDIEYFKNSGYNFSEEFLNYLRNFKFSGDVYAIPDGTPVFPNEPLVTVKAPLIEAQIIETAILSFINGSMEHATGARRIIEATPKGVPVMEFGARRARGIDSAVEASKYSYIGGCIGTSNVLAAKKYNIPALGTMAHSLVTEADDEYQAFMNFAKSNPNNCVFLVDTYDTLRIGIPNAIRVAKDYLVPNGYKFKGIRIDSGDLAYLSKEARKMLDEAGFKDTSICLSNGLDEYTIRDLVSQGACFNSLGVGDNIAASKERIGGVYKLVAVEKDGEIIPKIKVSNDSAKTINPGYKKLYRFYNKETGYALGDVITTYDEVINENEPYLLINPIDPWKKTELTNFIVKELHVPIFIDGEQVYNNPSLEERKDYCNKQMGTMYPEIKRINNPHVYYVDLSEKLLKLKKDLIHMYTGK